MKKQNNQRKIQMFLPYVNQRAINLVVQTLKSGYIGEGPKVAELEKKLSDYLNSKYTLALSSGTAALHLALLVAGIKKGDEIITTAQTMFATSQEIIKVGAKPVFADIEYLTGNLNPNDVKKRISKKSKAILAVDWGGYPCDYDELKIIAKEHKLILIEDAAHALGAKYKDKPIGSVTPITCFSLQAIKILTSGDGGIICLVDKKSYLKARRLRWFGIDRFQRKPSIEGEPIFDIKELGFKYHMNDIAASIAIGNLLDLEKLLLQKEKFAKIYKQKLKNINGITLFDLKTDRKSSNWLFTIHVDKRLDFCRALKSRGVDVSVVHQRIDRNSLIGGVKKDLIELARFTKTHICLPIHNRLTTDDINYVVEMIARGW